MSKTEIAIALVCLALIYASYYGLQNIDEYLALRDLDQKRPVIGRISVTKNDTRHRTQGSFVWFKAKDSQDVRGGDSIFSGANSHVQVNLKDGSGVSVGENSLVVFNEYDSLAMPDLQLGNFNFKVNGTATLLIDGQPTTVQGSNSEIQVVVKKGQKPLMKLLKGTAEVQTTEPEFKPLAINRVDRLKTKDKSLVVPRNVILTDYAKESDYIWSLYDIYDVKDLLLVEKPSLPTTVKQPHGVAWSDAFETNTIVERSNEISFNEKERFVSNTGGATFKTVNLGPNYWRVSIDAGKSWSKTEMFTVTGKFSEASRPKITKFSEQIPLINRSSSIQLDVKSPLETIGYAAEASKSPDFTPAETKSFWHPGRQIQLSFYKPGQYYYRFRSVSRDQKLSTWSEVQRFNVYVPALPEAPELLKLSRRDGYPGETFRFSWEAKGTLTKTAIVDSQGVPVEEAVGATIRFRAKRTGRYKVIARSYNEFGQAGPVSKPFYIRVGPQPNHLLQAMKDKENERKLAEVEEAGQNTLDLDALKPLEKRNMAYKSSQFSVRGLFLTLQSSDQFYSNGDSGQSKAAGLAIRGMKWFDRNGFEALFKSHLANISQGQGTNLQSADIRLHRRFFFALPVRFAPEGQMSVFAGYGVNRNSGSNFANQYDLMKFGTSFEFAVGSNFSTGGEFVYGIGGDTSNQTEIAGHLNYFTSKDWSFGVGYRVYLFEAGSTSTAPNGTLPYREGYTEGYSSLNYHF